MFCDKTLATYLVTIGKLQRSYLFTEILQIKADLDTLRNLLAKLNLSLYDNFRRCINVCSRKYIHIDKLMAFLYRKCGPFSYIFKPKGKKIKDMNDLKRACPHYHYPLTRVNLLEESFHNQYTIALASDKLGKSKKFEYPPLFPIEYRRAINTVGGLVEKNSTQKLSLLELGIRSKSLLDFYKEARRLFNSDELKTQSYGSILAAIISENKARGEPCRCMDGAPVSLTLWACGHNAFVRMID
jgi:hypothetical protein